MWQYTVEPDNCLSVIAADYGETVAEVEHDNPQFSANWNLIYTGQKVKLKGHARPSLITISPMTQTHRTVNAPAHHAGSVPIVKATPLDQGGIDGVENAATIYTFLVNHGLTHDAAAGIVGNIGQESLGNAYSVGSGGCGLIGWTPCSVPVGDLWAQMDDVLSYIAGDGSIADINAHAVTPVAAADWFMTEYERCNPYYCNPGNREGIAQAVANAES